MNTTYQTLIVKFSEPITALDGIFDDTGAWGTDTLKGWIDDYESTRFTATDSHTAVITSEYNMECVATKSLFFCVPNPTTTTSSKVGLTQANSSPSVWR